MPKKPTATTVTLSSRSQLLFCAVVALLWFAGFGMNFLYLIGHYTNSGTWAFQISQFVVPLAWFLISLWLVWSWQAKQLTRLFTASFVTFLAFGIFVVLSQLEQFIRFHLYPPVFGPNDTGLWSAFGHEWTVDAIGLVLFLATAAAIKYRRKG